jgi:DNA-binding NarL/FixJ family response regulator
VTRQVRRRVLGTEILLFTVHDSEPTIEEALKNGARGYLLKTDAGRDLIEAITRVAAHRPFFTNKVTEDLLRNFVSRSKQVAKVLQVGLKTVETHRRSIMLKLNLSSSAALVRYAVRNKIVES